MAAIDPSKMTATQVREAMEEALKRKQELHAQRYSVNQQHIRSIAHGRNRIPTPPTHRDSAQRASARDDRANLAAYAIQAYISAADWAAAGAGASARVGAFDLIQPAPPPSIPYAGVTVGEIIGYRAWLVVRLGENCFLRARLRSLASPYIWPPGEIVQGDTGKVVKEWIRVLDLTKLQIWGGVYAFRSPELDEDTRQGINEIQFGLVNRAIAIGTCTLWGDVVEHEHGYRASHARLRSIDAVYGGVDIAELRWEYGLEERA